MDVETQPTTPPLRRLRRIAGKLLLALAVIFLTLEFALRIVPIAIPTRVLLYMEPGIRRTVAKGRFSTSKEMVPIERDDGGPILRVWEPFAVKTYHWMNDYGAVHEVKVDAQGFANPPKSYADRIDIVSLGDSFTFAHAIHPKDAWAVRIGPLTGRTSYNLGLAGNGLYEYLQFLKQFGLSRRPAIVVLNVYEGNELRDAVAYHRAVAGEGEMDELAPEPWHDSFLGRNSYAYNLVRASAAYLRHRSEQKAAEVAIDFRFQVGLVPFDGSTDEPVFARWQQEGRYGFGLFDQALEDFVSLAKEHAFVPIVTYSPSAHAAYAPVKFRDPSLQASLGAFSRDQRAYFSAKAKELGFRFLDLQPALRAAAGEPTRTNLLYYPSTSHFTKRGHAVVAEAIATEIQKLDGSRDR